jgi:hypothetical protein
MVLIFLPIVNTSAEYANFHFSAPHELTLPLIIYSSVIIFSGGILANLFVLYFSFFSPLVNGNYKYFMANVAFCDLFVSDFRIIIQYVPRLYGCAVHCDNLLRPNNLSVGIRRMHCLCYNAYLRQSIRRDCDGTQWLVYPRTCVPPLRLLIFPLDSSAGRFFIRALRNQLYLQQPIHHLYTLCRWGKWYLKA